MKNSKLELYFWPTPNGYKISILLEELGIPYNLNLVDILQGEQFKMDCLLNRVKGKCRRILSSCKPNAIIKHANKPNWARFMSVAMASRQPAVTSQ